MYVTINKLYFARVDMDVFNAIFRTLRLAKTSVAVKDLRLENKD